MRFLFVIAVFVACAAHADAPPTGVSTAHMQRAASLSAQYRQCLQDTLGERYIEADARDPVRLAAEIEKSCEDRLAPVSNYLLTMGYTPPVIAQTMVELKAMADGAAIAYVHRMPRYRF